MPEEGSKSTKNNVRPNKQGKSTKNVLINPFENKWCHIEEQIQNDILDKLSSIFIEYGLKAEKKQKFKGKNKPGSENEQKAKDKCSNSDTSDEFNKKTKELRSQLVFGINEVTRHLERDNLRLVLVSGSAKPAVITKHLLELSATRTCQALSLSNLNTRLSSALEFRSILAIGFKKNNSDYDHLKEFIDFCASNAHTTTAVPQLDLEYDSRSIKSEAENPDLSGSTNVTKQPYPVTMETNSEKQKFTSLKSKDLTDDSGEIGKKKIIPAHKSQTDEPSEDYSRFYVYKTKKEDQIRNNLDFIAFSMTEMSESEKSEDGDNRIIKDRKNKSKDLKRKHVEDSETYIPVQIKQLKSNPKKQKHKKKKNK